MNLGFKIKDSHLSSVKRNQPWLFYLIIGLSVTIAYMPTFRGEFILDDNTLIKNNPYIQRTHSVSSYLIQEDGIIDRTQIGSNYHTGYYRPLINLSYWIDYRIWGMNAPGFRTTNLILHLLSCFLLYHLIFLFVNDERSAFLATLIFSLHPANCEAVAWITSRNNILVTIFSLSSFYFYLRGRQSGSYLKIGIATLFFTLAMLSKEFAFMLLPIMLLHWCLFEKEGKDIRKEIYTFLPFLVVLLLYLLLRQSATGSMLSPLKPAELWSRIYYAPYLIVYHLKCIFFPYGLHSFSVRYPASWLEMKALSSILILALLGIFLWRKRNHKLALFSALSFLVAIFPVLNIIPTSAASLVALRWQYFPMTFLSIALGWLIKEALSRRRGLVLCGFSVALIYLGVYTYILNQGHWQNEKVFFRQEVLHFKNPLYAGGLAELYFREKRYEEAERYFKESIKYIPHLARTYINYSALLIDTGRPQMAISCLNKARPLTMTRNQQGEWYNNMGMAHFTLGLQEEALRNFQKAVIYSPDEPGFWGNLGAAYGSMGDYRNSIFPLKKGLEVAPNSIELRKNLAITYIKLENYEKAIVTLEKIPTSERRRRAEIVALLRKARHQLLNKGK